MNFLRTTAIALLFLAASGLVPTNALAKPEACKGVSEQCTKDVLFDKTMDGTVYSCYECKQVMCKDGGDGGLAGTSIKSVCTEKSSSFTPISDKGSAHNTPNRLFAKTDSVDEKDPGSKLDKKASSSARVVRDQRTTKPAPVSRDHRKTQTSPAARDHRSNTTATVRDHRIKSVYLTKDECTQLGGDVKDASISICGSGQHCNRTGRDGKIYRVCISKTDTATKNAPKTQAPRIPQRPGELTPVNLSQVVIATPLTNEECEGLGGVVMGTAECGGPATACITTDQHGVIRTACINKASE